MCCNQDMLVFLKKSNTLPWFLLQENNRDCIQGLEATPNVDERGKVKGRKIRTATEESFWNSPRLPNVTNGFRKEKKALLWVPLPYSHWEWIHGSSLACVRPLSLSLCPQYGSIVTWGNALLHLCSSAQSGNQSFLFQGGEAAMWTSYLPALFHHTQQFPKPPVLPAHRTIPRNFPLSPSVKTECENSLNRPHPLSWNSHTCSFIGMASCHRGVCGLPWRKPGLQPIASSQQAPGLRRLVLTTDSTFLVPLACQHIVSSGFDTTRLDRKLNLSERERERLLRVIMYVF